MDTSKPTAETQIEDWKNIPWRKLEGGTFRLQKRIYKASRRGDVRTAHRLQKLLMKSRAGRLLAVRRVTQDNHGKRTAGIDGMANVPPAQRLELAEAIHPKHWRRQRAKPVRRVWIPKPGKAEKRPLGIPVMLDRARQALAKMVLEPEWEARFEPNSYGFRPGRSAQDAREAIFNHIRLKHKFVLDADIRGCFDNISHQALLKKLGTFASMRRFIKGQLRAGIMERDVPLLTPSVAGTPQGGVLSPLLANIALHGMEAVVWKAFKHKEGKPCLVRYADDFVVLHPTEEGIRKAQHVVEHWLKDIGLEMKPEKTRITTTAQGFDFLGFTVRQFPVGKYHAGRKHQGRPVGEEKPSLCGFKTIIKPSKESLKRHVRDLGKRVWEYRKATQEELITTLNPLINGWARYFSTSVSKVAFSKMDFTLYTILRRWAKRRHNSWTEGRVYTKYWRPKHGFSVQDGIRLSRHDRTPIIRHVKVRGTASPYDGNLVYWTKRLRQSPMLSYERAKLLQLQQGKCPICGLLFTEWSEFAVDHILPRRLGGKDILMNKQLLHKHCHDRKTSQDGSHAARGGQVSHDRDHTTEEPDDVKVSSPVLEVEWEE